MELVLKDRDYVPDGTGGVVSAAGAQEVLARVLFKLTARRGAFPFLPELGSRLYLLRQAKPGQWKGLARQYAAEALAQETALTVTDVSAEARGERLWVTVELEWNGQGLSAQLDV